MSQRLTEPFTSSMSLTTKGTSMNVKQYVDSVAKAAGTTIDITGYVCFERGEGIEKKADNFAEEIASMIK